ncbi:MAG: DUF1330 domain-containing protein [Acidimicrobiales bacterium]
MPKGYAIFTEKVNDEGGMGAYVQAALPTVFAAGGTVIVAAPPEEVLEGGWHGNQTVILEFASVEAARAWYRSPDYQAVIGGRHAAAESNAVIISGFEMPTG